MSNLVTRVTRSDLVESFHVGFAVVMASDGTILETIGADNYPTYIRSSAKPFQAMAVLRSGAAEKFEFSDEELAVVCASHNAEDVHIKTVQGILDKIGCGEEHLDCGTHPPIDKASADELVRSGQEPTPIFNNCSGKHSGMLAVARALDVNTDNYLDQQHPVQLLIYDIVKEYTGEDEIHRGLDGCSAPVFYLNVQKLALAFARLAEQDDEHKRRIFKAMTQNPYLVAGRKRFDTEVMTQFPGTLISKGGGEAVLGMGFQDGDQTFGIAVKVLDGNHRAVGPMALKVLDHLGLMDEEKFKNLNWFWHPELKNAASRIYGSYVTEIED